MWMLVFVGTSGGYSSPHEGITYEQVQVSSVRSVLLIYSTAFRLTADSTGLHLLFLRSWLRKCWSSAVITTHLHSGILSKVWGNLLTSKFASCLGLATLTISNRSAEVFLGHFFSLQEWVRDGEQPSCQPITSHVLDLMDPVEWCNACVLCKFADLQAGL